MAKRKPEGQTSFLDLLPLPIQNKPQCEPRCQQRDLHKTTTVWGAEQFVKRPPHWARNTIVWQVCERNTWTCLRCGNILGRR